MRSEKQRQASRTNGAKSKGPKSPDGKNVSKFNGLKHGLRSNQVVLPDENVAEFQAELKGWADDWQPKSHTRAVLVERAAVASWRLRRCVRAESDLLMELAARADDKGKGGHRELEERVERAMERLAHKPAQALAELRSFPEGVERLIGRWDDLDEAFEDGYWGWNDEFFHDNLLALLGQQADAESAEVGPLAEASRRLIESNNCQTIAGTMSVDESEADAALIRAAIAPQREALWALHRTLSAAPAEPDGDGGLKFVNVSPEIMLLHRYEMAHERSLRAAVKDLVALERSGADLVGRGEDSIEVAAANKVKATTPPAPSGAGAVVPGAPSEPEKS
ncbi:MAG TPA: hypothetical protein VGH33_14740, partial [Isosphaeraceae bacterium]